MSRFLPKRDEVNPEWFQRWGETFGAPDLALEMMANERVFEASRDRMLTAFGIDLNADLKPEDVMASSAYGNDRDRLSRICGMVMHGNFLRTRTSNSDFQILSGVFPVEDLKIAISLHHLHPQESEFKADMDMISTLIERSGKACIHSWKTTLDEQAGMRIYVMETNEEKEEEIMHSVDAVSARAIVNAVSIALNNETSSIAA
jgi:hypothetical protein